MNLLPTVVRAEGMDAFLEMGGGVPLTKDLILKQYREDVHGESHDTDGRAFISLHDHDLVATFVWRPESNFVHVQPEAQEPVIFAIEIAETLRWAYVQHPLALVEVVARAFRSHVTEG